MLIVGPLVLCIVSSKSDEQSLLIFIVGIIVGCMVSYVVISCVVFIAKNLFDGNVMKSWTKFIVGSGVFV